MKILLLGSSTRVANRCAAPQLFLQIQKSQLGVCEIDVNRKEVAILQ